jgi:hypothetical protein
MLLAYKRAHIREKFHKGVIRLPRHRHASPCVCEWQLAAASLSWCSKPLSSLLAWDFQRERDRHRSLPRSVVGSSFAILRQSVCDLIPRRSTIDVSVKLRPNSGIIIKGSHANRYLQAVRPVAAKQARAAVQTESFHRAFAFSINFNQLFTSQQAKLFLSHAGLSTNRRSGMFAAPIAMTMTGADKGSIDFKTNPAAKTTASDNFLHSKP